LLDTLRAIGLNVEAADSFETLLKRPEVDFVISFLNRGGFLHSEMLAPLLSQYHDIPCLGGTPIVRGVSDDKHLMKRIAQALGVRTPDWQYLPRGGFLANEPADRRAEAFIVKPNASSASWGIKVTGSWQEALEHTSLLHAAGHDAIVESWIEGYDLAVPVIGSITPWYLPVVRYEYDGGLRSYEQKRDLVAGREGHQILEPSRLTSEVLRLSDLLLREIWPFDHGRFEFRVDAHTGEIHFIEVNLNCNLWSRKTIAIAARHVGLTHAELLETIICHSLHRQSLLEVQQVPERAA
jgi:D-alanine-D-alanine ligase